MVVEFVEINIDDDINKTTRKSNHNFKELQKVALSVWHDFQCVDLTNGDRKRFQDWVLNLFLEKK